MAPRRVPDRSTGADLSAASLVLWTWFVWGGRIRNALGDPALGGSELIGTLTLAGSFVSLATVLAVLVLRDRGRPAHGAVRVVVTWTLALWTTGVWVVRAVAIAGSGEHEIGFVVVHVVLAVVSVVLSAWALAAVRRRGSTVSVATG